MIDNERTRINSKGRVIRSNHGVTRIYDSQYRCNGCGREFSAFDLPHYSLAVEGDRLFAQNQARAMRHADACKGDGEG